MAMFGRRVSGKAATDSSGRTDVTHPGSSPAQKTEAQHRATMTEFNARQAALGKPTIPMGKPVLKIDSSSNSNPAPTLSRRETKRKDKALKSINKNPLTPDPSSFGSASGFKQSDAGSAYDSARYAEQRLAKGNYPSLVHTSAKDFKQTDEDTVGSYIATGKSGWSDEGQKWIAEKGSGAKKKRDEEYG